MSRHVRFSLQQLLIAFVGISFLFATISWLVSLEPAEAVSLILLSPMLLVQLAITGVAKRLGQPGIGGAIGGAALWSTCYVTFGLITAWQWQFQHLLTAFILGAVLGSALGLLLNSRRPAVVYSQRWRKYYVAAFHGASLLICAGAVVLLFFFRSQSEWILEHDRRVNQLQKQGLVATVHRVRPPWWLQSTLEGDACIRLIVYFSPELPNLLSSGDLQNIPIIRMYLNNASVDDELLRSMAPIPSIIELGLNHSNVTDDGMAELAKFPSLQMLYLDNTQITDAATVHLARLSSLQRLFLANTRVSGDSLQNLAKLPQLIALDLTATPIDDDSIANLSGMTSLKHIKIVGTPVSDVGINRLPQCVSSVYAANTKVTSKSKASLAARTPPCILHDVP